MVYRTLRGVVAPVVVIILALALVPAAPAAAAGQGPGVDGETRSADAAVSPLRAFTGWLDAILARWTGELPAGRQALSQEIDSDGELTSESTDDPIGDPELGVGMDPNG